MDCQETTDLDINLNTDYKIARFVNNNKGCIAALDDRYNNYYWGFTDDTKIKLGDEYIDISKIRDKPEKYDSIQGVVEINMEVMVYDYNGVFVSGNTLVYENGIWSRVFQS